MARGDHLYVRRRRRYTHHGIDCGDGSVIHFVRTRGGGRRVARTSLEDFAVGSEVRVRTYRRRLPAEETVRNAESRIGRADYHLLRNNCEHLATWCCTGRPTSSQVRHWLLATQGAVASVVAVQAVGVQLAFLGTFGATLCATAGRWRGSKGTGRGGGDDSLSRATAVPAR